MKNKQERKKRCTSWYHHGWFRVVLLLVGIDMFIIGIVFALGANPLIFFVGITGPILRAILGALYVLVSIYIIKYSLSYQKMVTVRHLVCEHCVSKNLHDSEE